jgi:two-component system, NarL family, response regulator DevR
VIPKRLAQNVRTVRTTHAPALARTAASIRIVVVDDHEIIRHGLRQTLAHEADMDVVGEARSGADAIRVAEQLQPDIMLLDVKLDDLDGPEVCRRVLAVAPRTAVVMLTSYLQDGVVLRSLVAGAKAYVIKDVELSELKRTIRSVYRGHSVLDPKIASRVIASVAGSGNRTADGRRGNGRTAPTMLSETDLLILQHLAKGLTNKEIAAQVHLSAHTIKDRLERIGASFDVRSRTEIVAEALRAGVI